MSPVWSFCVILVTFESSMVELLAQNQPDMGEVDVESLDPTCEEPYAVPSLLQVGHQGGSGVGKRRRALSSKKIEDNGEKKIEDNVCSCDPLDRHWASLRQGRGQALSICSLLAGHNLEEQAMQLLQIDGTNFELKALDITTGVYSAIAGVPLLPKAITTPPFGSVNAVGMSSDNTLAYAAFSIPGGSDNWYFGSIDFLIPEVRIVGKLPNKDYRSGAFDGSGNFFLVANNDGNNSPHPPTLERIIDPAAMQAVQPPYTNAPLLAQGSGDIKDWSAGGVADIVVFSKAGVCPLCVLGFAGGNQGSVIMFDLTTDTIHILKSNMMAVLGGQSPGGFGAAWIYGQQPNQQVYFAANSGGGVLEILLDTVDFNAGTVQVALVGSSEPTTSNDGLNCMFENSPFVPSPAPTPSPTPLPTQHPPTPSPTGPGCEYFCLDNGCQCQQPWSMRCGLTSCHNCTNCLATR